MGRLQAMWAAAREAWRRLRDRLPPFAVRWLAKAGALRDRLWQAWLRRRELRPAERQLLEASCGVEADMVLLTRSRVDVGQWLKNGRLWLAWANGSLLLFAAGKRPFVERLAAAELAESLYNQLTAELVLLPAAAARQRKVRVAPVEGWRLLERMRQEDGSHA